jgi:hypothetical protein
MKLRGRTKYNKAVVAVANKLVRILWAVLAHNRPYESTPVAVAA